MTEYLGELFGLEGRVAVVTGAGGALGSRLAAGLARAGARVVALGRRPEPLQAVVGEIEAHGGKAVAESADVLDAESLERCAGRVLERWGRLDVLVTAAGGNVAGATLGEGREVWELDLEASRQALDLNFMGTLTAARVFGSAIARSSGAGSIVTLSSMAAGPALTRVAAYGAAKAAVENLTRWLAVELARRHGPGLRVNALAPGFFVGEQNRSLLLRPDGSHTERGAAVVARTPAGRFGDAAELVGAAVWLCGPSASFVTGQVIAVDGGFSAWSGV